MSVATKCLTTVALTTAAVWGAGPSWAQSLCPLPHGIRASLQMASQAMDARKAGQSLMTLATTIPEVQKTMPWAASLMSTILSEVYSKPLLDRQVYTAYRMEVCYIDVMERYAAQSPKFDFNAAWPLLKAYETQTDELEQRKCSMHGCAHGVGNLRERQSRGR